MGAEAGPYVLLVEDEPPLAEVYGFLLEGEGYRVRRASNGAHALDMMLHEPGRPALVLTDLMMPRMSGWELCRRITETPGLADVPVVILSAVGDTAKLPDTACVKVAFCKPPTIDALLDCVARWAPEARRPG